MRRPAFQFYPADWRKDVELQSCSMAAQGLWINAMCLAHECEPYGHLTINGKAMTPAQLGRQVGLTAEDAKALLDELLDSGVARRTEGGIIYSSRMVRDEQLRNVRAESGRLGGNPALVGKKDKQEVNQTSKQNTTPSSSSSSSPSGKKEPKGSSSSAKLPTCPMDQVIDLYHTILPSLPAVRLQTDGRKRALRKTWEWVLTSKRPDGTPRATNAEEALDWLMAYFERATENDFLMGRTPRTGEHANWKCDLDFLLTERGMKHVIEKTQVEATE